MRKDCRPRSSDINSRTPSSPLSLHDPPLQLSDDKKQRQNIGATTISDVPSSELESLSRQLLKGAISLAPASASALEIPGLPNGLRSSRAVMIICELARQLPSLSSAEVLEFGREVEKQLRDRLDEYKSNIGRLQFRRTYVFD